MKVAPQFMFTALNLVLVDCAKTVACATELFALLESLYVFLSSTKAHVIFVHKQAELHPHKAIGKTQ